MTGSSALHTDVEKEWYNRLYKSHQEFASSLIREHFLSASEGYFIERLTAFAATGARMLEIGCGCGTHAILAAQAGATVVAIDVSAEAIGIAQKNAQDAGVANCITFIIGDVENLEKELGEFDVVIDHEVFSSLDISRFLPVCARLLRSGGTLLGIECLGHNPIFNLNRTLKALRGKRTKWAATHVTTLWDLAHMEGMSRRAEVRFFHLTEIAGWPISRLLPRFYERHMRPRVRALDAYLFKRREFQKLAFKVVFEFVM